MRRRVRSEEKRSVWAMCGKLEEVRLSSAAYLKSLSLDSICS